MNNLVNNKPVWLAIMKLYDKLLVSGIMIVHVEKKYKIK